MVSVYEMVKTAIIMLNILFPKVCEGCAEILVGSEEILCLDCAHQIPLSYYQDVDGQLCRNKFYGRFLVEGAAALINFQKRGITQVLMHNLKYKGRRGISNYFGRWLGEELAQNSRFSTVEMVIPVPLHKQKLRVRGYNQVEGFGKEIAKALNVPYRDDILLKVYKSKPQVFKNRLLRFEAEEEFINAKVEEVNDRHILLVDDIITTGATLEKCALQLLKGRNVRISVATMANSI